MHPQSGIGAAITDFDSTPEMASMQTLASRRNESFTVARLKKSMNAVSSNNIRHLPNHTFSRPSSLTAYSLEDNNAIGLNVFRHGYSMSPNPTSFMPAFTFLGSNQVSQTMNLSTRV